MPRRIKTRCCVNGREAWLTGDCMQDILDAHLQLCIKEGIVYQSGTSPTKQTTADHSQLFGDYLLSFLKAFKSNQQTNTVINRERLVKNHILPRFGNMRITDISAADIQKWFDDMAVTYSKETITKLRNIVGPAFDAAVEDGLITRNPAKSKRLKISGKETIHHKAIPAEKIQRLRDNIFELETNDRRMAALLCSTGMRLEEVLGVQWSDIDVDGKWINVERAVVHPKRNKPEVKVPKTKESQRRIPIPDRLITMLSPIGTQGFVLLDKTCQNGDQPMTYTQVRNAMKRICNHFDLQGFSAHDFRDTCATEWREQGIQIDVIARMLGHTKTETTEQRYVKYRPELFDEIRSCLTPVCDTKCDTPPCPQTQAT